MPATPSACTLTEAFQIVPEQSTAAIVMHHPQASYFNAAATRELAVGMTASAAGRGALWAYRLQP